MITENIPKDPRKYTTKVFAGFTAREIVCFGLAAIMAIGLYQLQKYIDLWEPNYYVCLPCLIPLFIGFFPSPIEDQPFEKYLFTCIKNGLLSPANRPYETISIYRKYVDEGYIEEDERIFPQEPENTESQNNGGKKKTDKKNGKKEESKSALKKIRKKLEKETPELYMGYK